MSCWGDNTFGQLGDGTTTSRTTPVTVSGLLGAVGIGAALRSTCAMLVGGTVRCWGYNAVGQLGDGTTASSSTPVTVAGLGNVSAITAGGATACALLDDGSGRCWGYNADGQLGDGTTTNQTVPDTITGLAAADGINTGEGTTCTLVPGGNLDCWGENDVAQLGDNSTTERLTPVPVVVRVRFGASSFLEDLDDVAQSVDGRDHACAAIADGSVYCWGANQVGQIGIGTTSTPVTTATKVPSFTLNINPAVALARDHRTAVVDIIATCAKGRRLHVSITLSQRRGSRSADGNFTCAGRLDSYPITLHAAHRHAFASGAAKVVANAVIRRQGKVVDRQRWTRAVMLLVCSGHSVRLPSSCPAVR